MNYTDFLKKELVPAFGCTEPIAIALAAAKSRQALGAMPDKIIANLSGNMIKNANSVKVPGTMGRQGIEISVVTGAILGDPDKDLEVLADIDKSQLDYCDKLIEDNLVEVNLVADKIGLYIEIIMLSQDNKSRVIIEGNHTNITLIEKNGQAIHQTEVVEKKDDADAIELSFDKIYYYAKTCDIKELKEVLDRQIQYNIKIAEEGLENDWGSNIGSIILDMDSNNYFEKLAAYAAAGSDARMSGCELPVVINSGSGNQGITTAVPIVVFARDHDYSDEDLYRSLIFGNLMSLYVKQRIGKLSAYCGVVSAASSAIAAIAFMKGEDKSIIQGTISNALATNSGIICDGAKASCASKIASSLRNAALSYKQALANDDFKSGDGIVKENVDETIKSVGIIAEKGMKVTDQVVLEEVIKK